MIAFDDASENYLERPWIALEWVDGHTLEWPILGPHGETKCQAIMREIARISVDFLQVQKPGI